MQTNGIWRNKRFFICFPSKISYLKKRCCFRNEKTNQNFDLAIWDIGEVIPRYLDNNYNEQDSKSILEAIDHYTNMQLKFLKKGTG